MKKTFKQQIKDFWNENKRVIKVGITFGALGFIYGFTKGMTAEEKLWLDHGFERAIDNSETPSDELGLTEENSDDPEYLELVRLENENS